MQITMDIVCLICERPVIVAASGKRMGTLCRLSAGPRP